MRNVTVEAWDCGDCGSEVSADTLFAWCDGCSRGLCVACLDVSTTCADCDTIVCRHCTLRVFTLDCEGCGFALHVDCSSRRRHPHSSAHALCGACSRSAAAHA